ncbi:MAG: SURF1 family cytochrome oxidase biogenesis protein, partial [Alphaproteobacteria bacterium]
AATPEGVWPKGGQTPLAIKNDHLEYALTWFGLALTLIGVYIAWHVQAARAAKRED